MCRWRTYESNKKHPLQQEIGWTIHHCKLVPKFISLVAANSCWRAPPPVFCYVLWLFNSVQPLTTDVTIGPFSEYNGILGPWMVGAQCSLAFPRILKISDFILYTYIYMFVYGYEMALVKSWVPQNDQNRCILVLWGFTLCPFVDAAIGSMFFFSKCWRSPICWPICYQSRSYTYILY